MPVDFHVFIEKMLPKNSELLQLQVSVETTHPFYSKSEWGASAWI